MIDRGDAPFLVLFEGVCTPKDAIIADLLPSLPNLISAVEQNFNFKNVNQNR